MLIFNRLHGVVSQKIEFFITTAVRTSNCTYLHVQSHGLAAVDCIESHVMGVERNLRVNETIFFSSLYMKDVLQFCKTILVYFSDLQVYIKKWYVVKLILQKLNM
jgi:hypothetical protein